MSVLLYSQSCLSEIHFGWYFSSLFSSSLNLSLAVLNLLFKQFTEFLASVVASIRASLVAQRLKLLPAMWETWVGNLGREDPLEKGMATHSSILAWRIPWTEKCSSRCSI